MAIIFVFSQGMASWSAGTPTSSTTRRTRHGMEPWTANIPKQAGILGNVVVLPVIRETALNLNFNIMLKFIIYNYTVY